jgi:spore germination protein KC
MKRILCSFLILSSCLLSGCFNYHDIDKVIFATAVIVDVNEVGNPVVYVEGFKSDRNVSSNGGKNQKVLFKGSKKTLFETLRDIAMSSSYKINYTNTRVILLTEKAAEKNMADFIDFLDRDKEFIIRSYLAVLKGDPEKFINTSFNEQEFIGMYIYNLTRNVSPSSRAIITTLNDFLNSIYSPSGTSIISMVQLKKDSPEAKIELSNGAIIKDFKMVDILDNREGLGYNFFIDNVKSGSLEVTNPDSTEKFLSLEIVKNRTNTNIYYNGNDIKIKKTINTSVSVAEAQNRINLNTITIDKIKKAAEDNIRESCYEIFNKYKGKNLDIFKINDNFYRKYPRANVSNPLEKSYLDLEVNVEVSGSSNKLNFRK